MFQLGFLTSVVISAGIIKASLVAPSGIIASDTKVPTEGPLVTSGISLTTSNIDVVKASQIILIAVKPDVVGTILSEIVNSKALSDAELEGKCFISIAAGIPISAIEDKFVTSTGTILKVGVIRVMPNTPCLVGECAAAYASGTHASSAQKSACEAIFQSVGVVNEVPEKLMDAVTGLSGSGPACKQSKRVECIDNISL